MKSFKQFITETPYVDPNLKKDDFKPLTNKITDEIEKVHNNSEKIADTDVGSLHRVDLFGVNAYYHHVDGKPREYSLITKSNIQRQIDKNGGNGKYIKQIMKYHADKHGELKSDDEQSIGGMKLWKSLYHEKDPKFKFHHYKIIGMIDGKEQHEKYEIDDDYLKNNEKIIWRDNKKEGKEHRIGMTPNV